MGKWEVGKTKAGEVWEGKKAVSEERLCSSLPAPAAGCPTGDS